MRFWMCVAEQRIYGAFAQVTHFGGKFVFVHAECDAVNPWAGRHLATGPRMIANHAVIPQQVEFPVMLEDHLWRVAAFQGNAVCIGRQGQAIADVAVAQCVAFVGKLRRTISFR